MEDLPRLRSYNIHLPAFALDIFRLDGVNVCFGPFLSFTRSPRNEQRQELWLAPLVHPITVQLAATSGKLHPSGASGARHARRCQTSIFGVVT